MADKKKDAVKHPWIARDGDVTPGKVSKKQKKANDDFNAVWEGTAKKKTAPRKSGK